MPSATARTYFSKKKRLARLHTSLGEGKYLTLKQYQRFLFNLMLTQDAENSTVILTSFLLKNINLWC